MGAGKTRRNLNTQVIGQHYPSYGVADADLMAQAYDLDVAIAGHGIADPDHRVGVIDEPSMWASLLHIAYDFRNWANVAGSVGKTT